MDVSWWTTDVRDLIAGLTTRRDGSSNGAAAGGSAAMLPVLHLAGDVVLGRAVAGMALTKVPLALAAFPALLLGGAAVAAAYLATRARE